MAKKVRMADLDLTTAEGLHAGAGGKPVVSAAEPAESALMRAVRYEDKVKMPPTGKLSAAEIAALGPLGGDGRAVAESRRLFPRGLVLMIHPPENTGKSEADDPTETDHWSFQSIRNPQPPVVRGHRLGEDRR